MEVNASDITSVVIHHLCIPGPCLHSVAIMTKGGKKFEFIQIMGNDLLRLITLLPKNVVRDKKTWAKHFAPFMDGDVWTVMLEKDHEDRLAIVLCDSDRYQTSESVALTIQYPESSIAVPKLPKTKQQKAKDQQDDEL